jgi:probable F420-dependent oxidoreductase
MSDTARMQIGLRIPLGPAIGDLIQIGRRAEAVGCDSVWISDHLVWPFDVKSLYPYSPTGAAPLPPGTPFFDPWVLLAGIAAATTSIRLATGVYILPLRHHLVTARAVASLDALSLGRVIFGVGIGWMEEEFTAADSNYRTRAARTDEIIDALRVLWGPEASVERQGSEVSFRPLYMDPKPPQGSALPIYVGGESPAALRRAARTGDGWLSMRHTPASAAASIATLAELRKDAGRQDLPFNVTLQAPWPCGPEIVAEFAAAGVDRLVCYPWEGSGEDWPADLDGFESWVGEALPVR